MVNKSTLLPFVLIIANGLATSHAESAGTNETTKKNVVIEGNGLYASTVSSDEPKKSCTDFILSKKDVIEFFASARHLTQREYSHDLSGSNCYSNGTLSDRSGTRQWRIDRARRGLLMERDGKASYYYCNSCSSDRYYEPCDIECEHGP